MAVPKADGSLPLDLSVALQYGSGQGLTVLYEWLKDITLNHMHPNIPYKGGADIIPTCGNTDGWNKVLETLTNEWSEDLHPIYERQFVLAETFCYTSAIGSAKARGLGVVPVNSDDDGFLPSSLELVLSQWDYAYGKRPHLMYTVSMGQNPTGGVISHARRREIYAICQKYDVIIVEDEPYWFLQYTSPEEQFGGKSSGYEFLDSLTQSYLNIDVEGRVIRLDTFSKNVAPGCRLGWITAQPNIVERILRLTESSTQQPSGFVQTMVYKMLADWGKDGWIHWMESLRDTYGERQKIMCDLLESKQVMVNVSTSHADWSHVQKTNLYEFVRPKGGMFVWIKVNFDSHPLRQEFSATQLSGAFWAFLTEEPNLVLASPGSMFCPTETIQKSLGPYYYRVCFAAIPTEDIGPVSERFGTAAQSFWEIQDPRRIKELIPDIAELMTIQEMTTSGLGPLGC